MTAEIIDFGEHTGRTRQPGPQLDPVEFYAELEKIGEDEVQTRLALAHVYGPDKVPLVVVWLRRKDQDRNEASNREQIEIAREAASAASKAARAAESSADSARATAREARKANKIATKAMIIAIGSMIVVIINALLD